MKIEVKSRWFYALLVVVIALMLVHAQFSFCQSDESFYLSTINRLYQGDRLLIDEWHPSQCYAPMLVPLYAVYCLFVPSAEGIILFFRIAYILFAGAVALSLFALLHKRYGVFKTTFAALLCLLYSRANINGPSYYNLCVQFTLACFLCVYAAANASGNPKRRILLICGGVLLSFAVLCSPYLAVFVVLGLMALLISKRTRFFALYIGVGAVASAAVYILFNIDFANLPELFSNLPYVFSDPQHDTTMQSKVQEQIRAIRQYLPKRMLLIEGIVSVLIIAAKIIRKQVPNVVWPIYTAVVVWFLLPVLTAAPDAVCYVFVFPFSVYMFPFVLQHLLQKKEALPVFLYIFGFFVAVAFFFASNTGVDAMTAGYVISSAAAGLCAGGFIAQQKRDTKVCLCITACVLSVLLVSLLVLSGAHRFVGIYRDAPLEQLTVRLEKGPAKGLLTHEANAKQYTSIYDVIARLAADDSDALVLHTARAPWAYLCASWGYGTPKSGMTKVSYEYLWEYYQLHPDRIPDYVFVYEPEVGQYETALFNNHKKSAGSNQNDLSGPFYEYMCKNGSIIHQGEYVTVYKMNNE